MTVAGQTTRVDTYHYSDEGDSSAWISSAPGPWTRNIQGPGGDLAATQDGATGAVTLQLANLHGDIIATATTSTTATALTGTQEQTEFGEPRTPSLLRYGYLGAKQRQLTYPWGTIQMGQRSYIPQIGRFLQTDPVPGGSANNYDYANQTPIDEVDLTGTVSVPQNKCATAAGAKMCRGGGFLGLAPLVHQIRGFVRRALRSFERLRKRINDLSDREAKRVGDSLREGFCLFWGRTSAVAEQACATYNGLDYGRPEARRIRRHTKRLVRRYG